LLCNAAQSAGMLLRLFSARSHQCLRVGLNTLDFMGALRRNRGLIAWVVSVALMGNLAAVMLCCAPKAAAFDYPVDLLGPLVICTDHGITTTSAQDDLAPDSSAKVCPLYTTPALAAVAVDLGTALERITPPTHQQLAFDFIVTTADELRRLGLESRAPPLSA
jgi:hypothetical protein